MMPLSNREQIIGFLKERGLDGEHFLEWLNGKGYEIVKIADRSYKIVMRSPITGNQVKKKVYSSLQDYDRYGSKIIKRYQRHYDLEVWERGDGEWRQVDAFPCSSE